MAVVGMLPVCTGCVPVIEITVIEKAVFLQGFS